MTCTSIWFTTFSLLGASVLEGTQLPRVFHKGSDRSGPVLVVKYQEPESPYVLRINKILGPDVSVIRITILTVVTTHIRTTLFRTALTHSCACCQSLHIIPFCIRSDTWLCRPTYKLSTVNATIYYLIPLTSAAHTPPNPQGLKFNSKCFPSPSLISAAQRDFIN